MASFSFALNVSGTGMYAVLLQALLAVADGHRQERLDGRGDSASGYFEQTIS